MPVLLLGTRGDAVDGRDVDALKDCWGVGRRACADDRGRSFLNESTNSFSDSESFGITDLTVRCCAGSSLLITLLYASSGINACFLHSP